MDTTASAMERSHPLIELSRSDVAAILQPLGSFHADDLELQVLGGLTNSSYRVKHPQGTWLVRVITGDLNAYVKEYNLSLRCGEVLPMPKRLSFALSSPASKFFSVAVHEWLEGETLDSLLTRRPELGASAGEALGRFLEILLNIEFKRCGFMSPQLRIITPFELNERGFLECLHNFLANGPGAHQLGQFRDHIFHFAQQHAAAMNAVPPASNLVHGDLHTNNIIVREEGDQVRIAGVVDWENAFAWSCLFDISQILEVPSYPTAELEAALLKSYAQGGGIVPDQWPMINKLIQLLSWCDILCTGVPRQSMTSVGISRLEQIIGAKAQI